MNTPVPPRLSPWTAESRGYGPAVPPGRGTAGHGTADTRTADTRTASNSNAGNSTAATSACWQLPVLLGTDLVVVDVETTGWLADAASITEIGAVRLSRGMSAAEFSELVNPGVPIPAYITELTGISDAMVREAPPIAEVLPKFVDFARDSVVVAHNAPFDIGFLTAACDQCGIRWPPCAVIDTAVLARLVLRRSQVADHKLATLSGHFGTQTAPSHRALADAKATAGVLAGLVQLLAAATPTTPAALEDLPAGLGLLRSGPSPAPAAGSSILRSRRFQPGGWTSRLRAAARRLLARRGSGPP